MFKDPKRRWWWCEIAPSVLEIAGECLLDKLIGLQCLVDVAATDGDWAKSPQLVVIREALPSLDLGTCEGRHLSVVSGELAAFSIPSFVSPPLRSMNVPLAMLCSLTAYNTSDEHRYIYFEWLSYRQKPSTSALEIFHCWFLLLRNSQPWILVPLAEPPPLRSRNVPLCRLCNVYTSGCPSTGLTSHRWLNAEPSGLPPISCQPFTGVPSAGFPLWSQVWVRTSALAANIVLGTYLHKGQQRYLKLCIGWCICRLRVT